MTSERLSTADGEVFSRRGVLKAAGAAGAGVLGTAAAARPAAATYCPRSPGYWANHEWPGGVSELALGGRTMRAAEWRGFLLAPPRGDKARVLARQLVATALNFRLRPPSDPNCVDEPLDALGGRSVRQVKARAEGWLNWSNFGDEGVGQSSWEVVTGSDGEREVVDGEPLAEALARFNEGRFFQLDCGCDDRADLTDRTSDREPPSSGADDGERLAVDSPALERGLPARLGVW